MNEFELIAAMLEDLNLRICKLETDSEGRGGSGYDDKTFCSLKERLDILIFTLRAGVR